MGKHRGFEISKSLGWMVAGGCAGKRVRNESRRSKNKHLGLLALWDSDSKPELEIRNRLTSGSSETLACCGVVADGHSSLNLEVIYFLSADGFRTRRTKSRGSGLVSHVLVS